MDTSCAFIQVQITDFNTSVFIGIAFSDLSYSLNQKQLSLRVDKANGLRIQLHHDYWDAIM